MKTYENLNKGLKDPFHPNKVRLDEGHADGTPTLSSSPWPRWSSRSHPSHRPEMTTHMQEWLARAAEELGVRIFVGYSAKLPDGNSIQTQALFPDFGGAFGTIVLESSEAIDASILRHWVTQGFAISTFSEPLPNEEFDLDNYSIMFSEWGWTSNERAKPGWMR